MKFEDTINIFLKSLRGFNYDISGLDLNWDLIFPDDKDHWNHIRIIKYEKTHYVHHIDGKTCSLEVGQGKSVQAMKSFGISSYEDGSDDPALVWGPMLESALAWLKLVKRDWIKANRHIQDHYPLNRRFGFVQNSLIRASLKDFYRVDKELGKMNSRKFIRLVENGFFNKEENTVRETMAAKDYFDYCKIAYIAGRRKGDFVDESLSGREMYIQYADGRDDGLLDIDEDSCQEFSEWIDGTHSKRKTGGHPWEIKRGGNTTHLDLCVFRPHFDKKNGFKVELRGDSISRLKEAIQMFLGIHKASLPISIADPQGIRRRLLAQDNIGIIPSYESLHRANQHFAKDKHIYDVLYYDDLGRYKRRIRPFITWEPLPLIKPKDI